MEKKSLEEIISELPHKNCGLCGARTCEEFARLVGDGGSEMNRCIYLYSNKNESIQRGIKETEIIWKDIHGRKFDFVLGKYSDDPGPRETIQPFNPANIEKLAIKKGDIVYGRPAAAGCPVTHCGLVMEEPDYFNGTLIWCVVGPIYAREKGVYIGEYNPLAYEGVVSYSKKELKVGMRYFFLPAYCMLQSRHSGLINTISRSEEGTKVYIEGIWIG